MKLVLQIWHVSYSSERFEDFGSGLCSGVEPLAPGADGGGLCDVVDSTTTTRKTRQRMYPRASKCSISTYMKRCSNAGIEFRRSGRSNLNPAPKDSLLWVESAKRRAWIRLRS